ncbi:hypothetical protein GCM10029976_052360 [Kribbella albertanoniae]|uniref:Uncharacterized protein n=1 Tax=Kribbella albertanoniae TaxID=1266829 RepID=A0A4R4Q5S4_9ACTN|nr:hypothetical protein [Kribbella albertanoniae]TDC30458.1 hypothetical protein E1261_13310 [Kribbella albertanoniae]
MAEKLHGDVPGMHRAAKEIKAASPVLPAWNTSPVKATFIQGVVGVSAAVTSSVQAAQGFGKTAADGFALFSEIIQLCANEYEQTDTNHAVQITRVAAATHDQTIKIDQVNNSDYYKNVGHYYSGSGITSAPLPPDSQGVN